MAISDILAQKATQYGVTLSPKRELKPIERNWMAAVAQVNQLATRYEELLSRGLDAYMGKIIKDPQGNEMTIKNISDLKYHKLLKVDDKNKAKRTSLILPKDYEGFDCELVVYELEKEVVALYALFNNEENLVYRRVITNI